MRRRGTWGKLVSDFVARAERMGEGDSCTEASAWADGPGLRHLWARIRGRRMSGTFAADQAEAPVQDACRQRWSSGTVWAPGWPAWCPGSRVWSNVEENLDRGSHVGRRGERNSVFQPPWLGCAVWTRGLLPPKCLWGTSLPGSKFSDITLAWNQLRESIYTMESGKFDKSGLFPLESGLWNVHWPPTGSRASFMAASVRGVSVWALLCAVSVETHRLRAETGRGGRGGSAEGPTPGLTAARAVTRGGANEGWWKQPSAAALGAFDQLPRSGCGVRALSHAAG